MHTLSGAPVDYIDKLPVVPVELTESDIIIPSVICNLIRK